MSKNITDIDKAELIKQYEILQELKRRKRQSRTSYKPNPGQLPVHSSDKKIRAVFSGNGAGKTTLGVHEAFWAASGYNPVTKKFTKVPAKVVVVLDDPEKVQDVWINEMRKWYEINDDMLRKNGKPYTNEIVFKTGSSIRFMFHLQEPLKFESIEVDYVIFDEPPPRSVWIALLRGGRTKGRSARYLFIGTPISGSWIRKEVFEPWSRGERDDIECFKFGTAVNERNLSDGYIDSFSRNLSEKEKRIRLYGDFFDLDGLALAHLWDRAAHVIKSQDVPEIVSAVVAIDPHPQKNHVAILLGVDREGLLYYIKELSSKAVPREFARILKTWYQGYRLFDIVCDSLGSTPMTGGEGNLSFIEVLRKEGIRVRPTTYEDKLDESWITRIQDCLTLPKDLDNFGKRAVPLLRVVEGNHGIVGDIETVNWIKVKNEDYYKPKLDMGSKDFLACLKYALACNLTAKKNKDKMFVRNSMPKSYLGAAGNTKKKSYDFWKRKFTQKGIWNDSSKDDD